MADVKQTIPEFELLKQKATQRARIAGQEASGAIKRRFAALGGLQTGAAIKAQSIAQEKARRGGEEQVQQLGLAEVAEATRRGERAEELGLRKEAFGFQKEEAAKGHEFQEKAFEFGKETKLQELKIAERELSLNEDIASFNKMIAEAELGRPTDIFGQLLGPKFSSSNQFGLGSIF